MRLQRPRSKDRGLLRGTSYRTDQSFWSIQPLLYVAMICTILSSGSAAPQSN